MSRYLLSAEAQRDIEDIRTYYLTEATTGVGRRVISELARGFQRLASAPGIGHRRTDLAGEPLRFWQVFSYLIIYDPTVKPIAIARVLHSSRDIGTILMRHGGRSG